MSLQTDSLLQTNEYQINQALHAKKSNYEKQWFGFAQGKNTQNIRNYETTCAKQTPNSEKSGVVLQTAFFAQIRNIDQFTRAKQRGK